jgi:hypothetical protein
MLHCIESPVRVFPAPCYAARRPRASGSNGVTTLLTQGGLLSSETANAELRSELRDVKAENTLLKVAAGVQRAALTVRSLIHLEIMSVTSGDIVSSIEAYSAGAPLLAC